MADEENCNGEAAALSQQGLRIGSIFVIMVASLFGAVAPIILARQSKMHVPKFTFFVCKYFGTGVILATAWMHLLAPAIENLGSPCLEDRLPEYPWPLVIGLMTVMFMFFIELLATHYTPEDDHNHGSGSDSEADPSMDVLALKRPAQKKQTLNDESCPHDLERDGQRHGPDPKTIPGRPDDVSYPPGGEDHLAHRRDHSDNEGIAGQLTAIFILEFGVLFHSVFVGLTLGTTKEFTILFIVIIFHQLFEGLGLGSRLAVAPWPKNRLWLPYLLAVMFALSTPVGIAAGLGAKPKNATDQILVNGIFDSISAGILMYTGLVELLAHEFMFNPHMRRAPLKTQLFAFGCVCAGVALMSLLAKWA